MLVKNFIACFMLVTIGNAAVAQKQLYQFDNNALSSRWSSPENINGTKGAGGKENNRAKGHAFDVINAGESKLLLDVQGTGIINRIWMTFDDRSPEMLRSLKLEMFWDNEQKPAVSVPLGDFFGVGLGRTTKFQNALFANAEGRSFICFIPMPFKKAAKVRVTNESGKKLGSIYFDVDFQYLKAWQNDFMYFHACWNRDTATALAKDFELLPRVTGAGRYLGANIGINANPVYGDSWWGEGEVKMYVDGDNNLPTLVGTGTEDYIGSGWGQGEFINNYSGCPVANDKKLQWAYYRYHIPDPVLFGNACHITLQQIGGNSKEKVIDLQKANVPLIPVTLSGANKFYSFYKKDSIVQLSNPSFPGGWANFYRSDDVSATAYFYLNSPTDNLPPLQSVAIRTYNLKNN